MRLNRYIAIATGLSRRAADDAIASGRVRVDGLLASPGQQVDGSERIELNGATVTPVATATQTILFHKPAGYVVSRNGQGAPTIYALLPPQLHHLKPVGRLDKDSSGLLVLTNDGLLAHQLTHPRFNKQKRYEADLDKPLHSTDRQRIEQGIMLDDGPSTLHLRPLNQTGDKWIVTMSEGRNRQIRRTFAAAGYTVRQLHRTDFGEYRLPPTLPLGAYQTITVP